MASTYTPIATTTLGSAASSVYIFSLNAAEVIQTYILVIQFGTTSSGATVGTTI
jgi:hypothetical protein